MLFSCFLPAALQRDFSIKHKHKRNDDGKANGIIAVTRSHPRHFHSLLRLGLEHTAQRDRQLLTSGFTTALKVNLGPHWSEVSILESD